MNRLYLFAIILILQGCTSSPQRYKDPIDNKMYSILMEAMELQKIRNYSGAVEKYYDCIALKPESNALNTSQPRRWCQNNIVNLLISCENTTNCDPAKGLQLAQELVNYNPLKGQDVAYSGTLAKALAANGNYVLAAEEMKRVIGFMGETHEWRSSYIALYETYKAKAVE